MERTSQQYITLDSIIGRAYEKVEGNGKYKFFVLYATIIAIWNYAIFLNSHSLMLIMPEIDCFRDDIWIKCNRDDVCLNQKYNVPYVYKKRKGHNFITEFDWYCEKTKPAYLISSMFFFGATCSALFVGMLSDLYGRVIVLCAGMLGSMASLSVLFYIGNEAICPISIFVYGAFAISVNSNSFNYLTDSIHEKYRGVFPTILAASVPVGNIIFATLMKFDLSWREGYTAMIYIETTFFFSLFIIRESPVYYFFRGIKKKTCNRLEHIAKINGVKRSSQQRVNIPRRDNDPNSLQKRIKEVFRKKNYIIYLFMFCIMRFTGNLVYYGVSLNVEKMGSDTHLNAIILGFTEFIACIVSYGFLHRISEKRTLAVGYCICLLYTSPSPRDS